MDHLLNYRKIMALYQIIKNLFTKHTQVPWRMERP